MAQKILIVLDGPQAAAAAITGAFRSFGGDSLALTLLAVLPAPNIRAQQIVPAEQLRAEAVAAANVWIDVALQAVPSNVKAEHRIAFGRIPEVVESVLAQTPHDAVVVCPRRRGKLSARCLPDPIGALARACAIPVICIPPARDELES